MPKGYFCLVLHSHLPFVKHPEYEYFLEEHWLFEALTETYLPFLMMLKRLYEEKVNFKITVSLTPTLCEMLSDKLLSEKFVKYLDRMIELSEKELSRTRGKHPFYETAKFYHDRFKSIKNFYENELNKNVLSGYSFFKNEGRLEIITSAATHGLLPALQGVRSAVLSQLKVGVKNYKKHFKTNPRGIWLPECGYYCGLESELKSFSLEFFFLDTHAFTFAKPFPKFGVFSPIKTESGNFAFARDPESSKQVWSADEGYPGDPWYRDFYRDIGFDLPLNYIKPYINPDGARTYTGFKYYRVTGKVKLSEKLPYVREKAIERAKLHAAHFHLCRDKQAQYLLSKLSRPPLIVSPYDAELFGHWWFEGNEFLYFLFKQMQAHSQILPIIPPEYLSYFEQIPTSQPSTSSWGNGGYFEVWINGKTDWVYKYLTDMALLMKELKKRFKNPSREQTRLLNQMLRELLLAQSSDWTFLITTSTAKSYAERRLKEHINNFYRLKDMLLSGKVDFNMLSKIENKDSLFPEINFKEDWPS